MNNLEQAESMGAKAGLARRRHDQTLYTFLRDHYRRWVALEPKADKEALDAAWARGYSSEAA